ncbi:hypothetical protein ACU64V_14620 [Lysinibacillus capsici]
MFIDIKNAIVKLDLDVLITFIVGLGIIFFGISNNVRDKTFRLKNILILYISLFIVIIFFSGNQILLLFILIGILAGGIIFLHDKDNDLEKELGLHHLLFYYSFAWIFLNKTYIWIFCCITIIFLNTKFSLLTSLYQNKWINLEHEHLIIFIILIFALYQYSKVAISFFDFYNFQDAVNHLKICLFHDGIQRTNNFNKSIYNEIDQKIDLLSFVLFMEDKNMFLRNKPYPTIYRDFFCSKFSNERQIHFPNISFNNKYTGFKKLKRYARGYATIEQQFLRQRVLKDNSYRYKIRRKLFIEYLYCEFFFKAICKRKSMTYSRKKKTNKKIAKKLRKNLKYHFLISYFLEVLKNPKNEEELLTNMSKNSRVSKDLYQKLYDQFKNSTLQNHYQSMITDAKESPVQFQIKDDN